MIQDDCKCFLRYFLLSKSGSKTFRTKIDSIEILDMSGDQLWTSNDEVNSSYLKCEEKGNFAVYDFKGRKLWSTKKNQSILFFNKEN